MGWGGLPHPLSPIIMGFGYYAASDAFLFGWEQTT